MRHLPNPSTIVSHPNVSPLQAALISHHLPGNVCLYLDSRLSGDSVVEFVRNCGPFHTIVFNPTDKESYLNVLTSLIHIQGNVSIMFGPETSVDHMNNLVSRVIQNSYIVFHPQMTEFTISQCMKKMSPHLKLLLHPEASLKQAITIAFNLSKSKTIYFFPGTSEEQMKAINKGVGPHIRFLPYTRHVQRLAALNMQDEEKSLRP